MSCSKNIKIDGHSVKDPKMFKGVKIEGGQTSLSLSYVADLNPAQDLWNMKVKIIRKSFQSFRIDLILLDEKGSKIQACVKSHLVPVFDIQLQEDDVVILSKFGVGENSDQYKVVVHDYKINFYRCTTVTRVDGWQGPEYSFKFIPHQQILDGKANDLWTVDVVGTVLSSSGMDIFGKPPKEYKRLNFDLQDLEGTVVKCTLWNAYAQQMHDFVLKENPIDGVIGVIQHGKVKDWKGELTVQSDRWGSRLFLNKEIGEINDIKKSLIVRQGQSSTSSQTILSTQTVFPMRQEFLIDHEKKLVDAIAEIERPMLCVVVATIKIVQEIHGWFYPACRKCSRKVMSKSEYLQHAEIISEDIFNLPPTSLFCSKCDGECKSVTTKFKVHVRVQDDTGSKLFIMFDQDVTKIVGQSASDIRDRQVRDNEIDSFPHELSRLVEKRLAFKIEVSEFNLDHDYLVYTVKKVCDDIDIINELVGGNGNEVELGDEVSQGDSEFKAIQLGESSQGVRELISKDVVSVTADSSAIEAEKDSGTSPNGKRTSLDAEIGNVGELSSTNKRNRKKPSKLNN